MKADPRKALDDYYRDAGSWAEDRQAALRASRRIAWIVAAVAAAVAICEALALAFLLPLKTVVPYTLLVDRQTGYVQELKPLDADRIAPDAALTQSFLVQYVIAREGFDRAQVQSNYRKVLAWSVDPAAADYRNAIQAGNPLSPLNRLPSTTLIDVRVKSVSSLGGTTALVRFDTIRRDGGGQPQVSGSWISIVRYRFTTAPLRAEDRFVNPLGFQVISYRRNQEAVTPPEPAATPTVVITTPQVQTVVPGTTSVTGSTRTTISGTRIDQR